MPSINDDLDRPIWGAAKIAVEAGLIDDATGKPNMDRAYFLLRKKLLPADKIGRSYVSTRRRLRKIASGE
jgi:hypothetical protein